MHRVLSRAVMFLGPVTLISICSAAVAYAQVPGSEMGPLLARLDRFFNPPFLNHWMFSIATIMIAVMTLPAIGAFQGAGKWLVLAVSFYCWGRIVMMLLTILAVGRGGTL